MKYIEIIMDQWVGLIITFAIMGAIMFYYRQRWNKYKK